MFILASKRIHEEPHREGVKMPRLDVSDNCSGSTWHNNDISLINFL